ncbi:ABC transporter substrate-binding protein, partial [Klebsiella pneumoniae]|uniref:ABC transporter substrate-binding protein n=1 Tax=Escherichia coli TaxID=562 RepID=UPI00259D8505
MKKNISIIVAAVVLVAVLVGGLFLLRKNESDKIVIWAFDTSVVAAEEAVKAYKKDNPDVEFEVVEFSQDQLVQKFRVALASGSRKNLPNIIIEEDYNMQGYFKYYEDYFVDLSDHLDTDDYMDFKITSSTYNDKLLAVPYDSGVSALFYRLDIIQEAGYSEEDMQDLTWDEFIAIGEEVKTATGKPMLPISPEGNIEGRVMLQSAGKWYYDLDGNLDITDNQAILDTM